MNKLLITELLKQCVSKVCVILLLAGTSMCNNALAATVELTNQPLTTTASLVKPNLMFVFDTSLSMTQEISADYLANANQCKAVMREQAGRAVTALSRSGTTLTITAPGHSFSVGNVVYLAVPGNPDFNGIYTITKRNLTTTPSTCTAFNTSVIVNNPTCNGQTSGSAGNPNADPPVAPTPACSCNTPAPANNGSTTTDTNLTTPGSTNLAVCRWRDPRDNAIGTVCTASTGGGTTGDDTLEVTVANTGTSGAFTTTQLVDAKIVSRNDSTSCSGTRSSGFMTVSFHEPPLAAARVNGLYYDPNIIYSPPPNPLSTTTKLPGMDRANTLNWTKVRTDGLSLSAAGVQNSTTVDITKWTDMVYCDTPDRPAAYASDVLWHQSSRCKSNDLTSNTVASSPNYPYPYPAKSDGDATTLSNTLLYSSNVPQQQGASVPSGSNPVVTTAANGSFAYAERYTAANPFYYNVRPIEYCTNKKLNDCKVGAPTALYTEPSYVRYCNSAANATNITINPVTTACNNSNVNSFTFPRYGLFERVEIKASQATYPKTSNERTDCTGTTCTYDQEMTNFANWYAYYRTRLQLMKSTAATTFNSLNENYRIGLMTVEGQTTAGNYLPIADFLSGTGLQRENWFKTLYGRTGNGGTALRDVLTKVGKVYAGKNPIAGFPNDDPVQYSCQQNFTLLTTDGYWNGDPGTKLDGTAIGNQDGGTTARPQFEGTTAADTLADVAKYYYETDLRNTALGNCTGPDGVNVCTDDVRQGGTFDTLKTQHMTTFTLGLGVDGALTYADKYEDALSGDFYDLKTGAGGVNWPVPAANSITAVDDLWHAAVNGRGTYFSAKNPKQLTDGLLTTLLKISDGTGSGSATAISNPIPVAGDNLAYSARYSTGAWTGNLFARTITTNGTLSASAQWCVENEATVSPACNGSLSARVGAGSDSRLIYMNVNGILTNFSYGLMNATTQQIYFNSSYLSTRLSQWAGYNAYQQGQAGGNSLVNYLRGQNGFDDRNDNIVVVSSTVTNDNRLYRQRAAVLGDIVESDPVFLGGPRFSYVDPGYSAYKTANSGRARTVYVGANDGMLHAFNADTGAERWAYVPSAVLPNLYKLADKNYRNNHANYVNSEITIADICVAACTSSGVWKTILVSGLGQGGRGYFALDITNPLSPSFLWEISNVDEPSMGFSYGKPVVTKRTDGTWVVLVTSGYNNVSTGDGKGHLYVLRATNGTRLADIPTGVGSATTPSGLAQISAYADSPSENNQSKYVYGGDLSGNLWRFDIDAGTSILFTNLKNRPITVAPTLARINNKRVIYIGTGKYLEKLDLDLREYATESLYAIKDDDVTSTLTLGSTLVPQKLSDTDLTRTIVDPKPVDFSTGNGWYIDLPLGERQNVKSVLVGGVLYVPTLVPPTGSCNENGKGYLNAFDYKTGGPPTGASSNIVSTKTDSPVAGIYNVYNLSGNSSTPSQITTGTDLTKGGDGPPRTDTAPLNNGAFEGNRAVWRELIQ